MTDERELLRKLTAIMTKQQEVLKRLAALDPFVAIDGTQYPLDADGNPPREMTGIWELNADGVPTYNPFATDIPHDEMGEPDESEGEHVPFEDDKHLPSAEYEARQNLDNWNTDPEGALYDAPLHDDNTQKTFKLPEERMFKHPDETEE